MVRILTSNKPPHSLQAVRWRYLVWTRVQMTSFRSNKLSSRRKCFRLNKPLWTCLLCYVPVWRYRTYSSCLCVLFCSRVIYLQVSMNDGLSFISSNVHITTTECVSGSFLSSMPAFKGTVCIFYFSFSETVSNKNSNSLHLNRLLSIVYGRVVSSNLMMNTYLSGDH